MQIEHIKIISTSKYNKNNTSQRISNSNYKSDEVSFSGKPKLETDTITKKIKDFVEIVKEAFKDLKKQKADKKQAIIDAEKRIQAEEEIRRAKMLQKREENIALAQRNREEERKLREALENQRFERYKSTHPATLAKEYLRCQEQNDIVWAMKIKQILKSRGYAILDGKAVKEFSQKAYRPLEIIPYSEIPNNTYIARMADNPPLVKNPDIISFPERGNYSLANIGIYNYSLAQNHYGQFKFPTTRFGANTGLEIPGQERGWTMTHSYRPNLMDYDKYHYCTVLSYKHEENYLKQAPGFSILIEGEIQPKELEELKNIFITNGLMEKLLKSAGNKEEATKTFQEMAEIIVNYLNKIN